MVTGNQRVIYAERDNDQQHNSMPAGCELTLSSMSSSLSEQLGEAHQILDEIEASLVGNLPRAEDSNPKKAPEGIFNSLGASMSSVELLVKKLSQIRDKMGAQP